MQSQTWKRNLMPLSLTRPISILIIQLCRTGLMIGRAKKWLRKRNLAVDAIRTLLLGSGRQQLSWPGNRSGFSRLHGILHRGRGAWPAFELPGRASLQRLESGFRDADAAGLRRDAHDDT